MVNDENNNLASLGTIKQAVTGLITTVGGTVTFTAVNTAAYLVTAVHSGDTKGALYLLSVLGNIVYVTKISDSLNIISITSNGVDVTITAADSYTLVSAIRLY